MIIELSKYDLMKWHNFFSKGTWVSVQVLLRLLPDLDRKVIISPNFEEDFFESLIVLFVQNQVEKNLSIKNIHTSAGFII